MSQVVNQLLQPGGTESGTEQMVPTDDIESEPQKGSTQDLNAIGDTEFRFEDYGLKKGSSRFETNIVYYIHAKIKRMESIQDYDVELMSSDPNIEISQQLKHITITQAVAKTQNQEQTEQEQESETQDTVIKEYVDVEFLFTPLDNKFDIIVFKLKRNSADVINTEGNIILGRDPSIAFIELSEVQNKKPGLKPLKKIGLQSHPDLLFCINKEEFHLSRSGIFELRDGIVDIVFFSVVSGADLQNEADLTPQMEENKTINLTSSAKKPREIDAFILDYMYNDGED